MRHVSELRVRYAETDQMGVVYHSNYLIWCEVGRTDFIRAIGASYADLERDGVALAVVEAHLRYRRPARYDETIRVVTSVAEVRSRVVRFEYEVTSADGTVLVTGYTTLVAMSRDGKTSAIPPYLREALERVLVA
ncbi:MAG: acyl-CoA thioesterase [Gemmatimonadaceae bacterium]